MKNVQLKARTQNYLTNSQYTKEMQRDMFRSMQGNQIHFAKQDESMLNRNGTSVEMFNAINNERKRIGGELHDNVNQLLATALLFSGMMETKTEKATLIKTKIMEYLNMAINEIRVITHDLIKSEFGQKSLAGQLNKYINDLLITGKFRISFFCDDKVELLSHSKKLSLLRIFQEHVKNIINYSMASFIEVTIKKDATSVILTISDNGIGFDKTKAKNGIGLLNIEQRVDQCLGQFEISSSPGMGCKLVTLIPW